MQDSIIEIIKRRKSIRTYSNSELNAEIRKKIDLVINKNYVGHFGNKIRFILVEKEFVEKDKGLKLGTYGIIKGVKYFILGVVQKNNDKYNEDLGFEMEKVILEMTRLGLGTCWIGGLANFAQFSKSVELSTDEIIGAITPVGYSAEKMSVTEKFLRFTAGAAKRKKWNELFFIGSKKNPIEKLDDENFNTILEMVRLAPSASNKQPWRIIKENDKNNFHFYLKRTPGYQKMRKNVDLQKIDMGIAMCHFELAAKDLNIKGKWVCEKNITTLDEKDWQFTVTWNSI